MAEFRVVYDLLPIWGAMDTTEQIDASDFDELTDILVSRIDQTLASRRSDPACMCSVEFLPPQLEPLPDGTSKVRVEGILHSCPIHA